MTPLRCPDDRGGEWRTFQCVLDVGHEGPCEPYRPPTVDEWRTLMTDIRRAAKVIVELGTAAESPCPGCGL